VSTTISQIPEDSADVAGLSQVLTTRSIAHPEQGSIYDPMNFAAITPVHVHPTRPGRYVVLFSQRWYGATGSSTDPGAYTAHSVDTGPGWVIVDTAGSRRMASSESYAVPGIAGRTLTAACSRSNTYLYALSSVGAAGSVIQHFRWSGDRDVMLPVADETIPVVDPVAAWDTLLDYPLGSFVVRSGSVWRATQASLGLDPLTHPEYWTPSTGLLEQVRFDAGVYIYGADLVVIGRGLTSSSLYLMRKPWGRIGITAEGYQGIRNEATRIDDPTWRYASATGWSADPAELSPLPVTSVGPVSVVMYRDRLIMTTVKATGGTRTAEVWYSRHVSPNWTKMPLTVALGTAGSTYLGGTLQLQPEMQANTNTVAITALSAVAQTTPDKINITWTQVPVVS
jgi:hypothetical protein